MFNKIKKFFKNLSSYDSLDYNEKEIKNNIENLRKKYIYSDEEAFKKDAEALAGDWKNVGDTLKGIIGNK